MHPRRAKQGHSLALAFRRSAGTGVYIEIHEDSEHRRNARSRAQQIFSQALSGGKDMWYFTWILGLGFALAAGIINVLWLEATYAFGGLDEDKIDERFGAEPQAQQDEPTAQ